MKKIVIPGDLVTEERKRTGIHVFVENGKIYSDCLGITDTESATASVIPLQGKYIPHVGDLIVGVVKSEKHSVYEVDINSIYSSYMSKRDIRDKLKQGAIISAKVDSVNEINEASISDVRVFYGGEIIEISPVKVPRLIGKNGSMLDVLKSGTQSSLLIGRNGRVWAKNGDLKLLKIAIKKIEKEAHLGNLTNKMEEFMKTNQSAQTKNETKEKAKEEKQEKNVEKVA